MSYYNLGGNGQLREYFRKHKIDHLPLTQVYIRNETDVYRVQLRERVTRILSGEIPSEPYRKNVVTEVYTVYNTCNNSPAISPCNNSNNNTISNSNNNSAKDNNNNLTTSQPSVSKIKVIFLTGSLGLTLSQNGYGNAVISKLEVGGQAQLSGCHIGDYVISVNEVEVYDYIEVIRAIKESPRPLIVAFKRYNIPSFHTLLHPISPAHSPKANGGSSSGTPRQVLPIALKVVDRTCISTIQPHSLELSLTGNSSPRAASTSTRSSPRYLSSSSRSHYSDRPSSPRVVSESGRAIGAHPSLHLSLEPAATTPSHKGSASPASARVSTGRSAIPSGRSVKSIKSVHQPVPVEPAPPVQELTEDLAGLALIHADNMTTTPLATLPKGTLSATTSYGGTHTGEQATTGALESPGRVAVGVINTINEVLGDDPSYHSPYRLQHVDRASNVSHTTPTIPKPLYQPGTTNDSNTDESSRLLVESVDNERVDECMECELSPEEYVSPTSQDSPIADDGYDTYAYNLTDDAVDADIDADLIIKPVELYPEEEEGKAAKAETKGEKDTGPGVIEAFGQEQGEGEELEGLLHTVAQYDDHSVSSDDSSGSEELPLYNTDEDFLHDAAFGQNCDLIPPTHDKTTLQLLTLKVDVSDASFDYLQSSSRSIIESDLEHIHYSQGQSHYARLTQYDMHHQQQLPGEGYCVGGDMDGGGAMQGHLNTSYLEVNISCIMYIYYSMLYMYVYLIFVLYHVFPFFLLYIIVIYMLNSFVYTYFYTYIYIYTYTHIYTPYTYIEWYEDQGVAQDI